MRSRYPLADPTSYLTLPWSLVTVTSDTPARNQSGNATMSVKLSKTLKGKRGASSAAPTIHEYEERFRNAKRGGLEKNWRRGKATTRSSTISIMTWLRIPISTDGANPFTLHLASPERASRHRLLAMSALGPGTRIQTGDGRRRPRLWCRRVVIGVYPFFRRQNRRRKQQWLLARTPGDLRERRS